MSALLIVCGLGAAPRWAHAQEDDVASESIALATALTGTGLSLGAMMIGAAENSDGMVLAGTVGLIVAPSAGHFYAGETGRGLIHTGIRVAALGGTFAGVVVLLRDCGFDGEDDCSSAGGILIAGSMLTGAISAIYSIVDAPRAASRQNARARLRLMPAPMVGPDGAPGMGLHVGGSF